MTLLALLAVGGIASAGTAWALGRDGTTARAGAVGGGLALILIAALAAAIPVPAMPVLDEAGAASGALWNGALVPGPYVRLVVSLWAAASAGLAAVAWLISGRAGLRALLPASLAGLTGSAVALAAASPALGLVAAGATGLASVALVLAVPGAASASVAARELRIAVAPAAAVLGVASIAPVLSRLVLANPEGPASAAGSGTAAAVALGLLVMALVVAARVGAIPFHVRISTLTDTVPAGSLPLVAAWLPLPLAAAAAGVAADLLAPLALPVGSARAVIAALILAATVAAALAAFLQDDLRHAVGYLTVADLGLVVLAFAALDPAAWGPARLWLLTVATSKTALAAWASVAEDRFETRSVPDLRGWLRPSPVLGLGLLLTVLATYGLPGWAAVTARHALTDLAVGTPWNTVLLLASLLTLPTYLRWLWLGAGTPTSHVDRAEPELAGGLGALPARRLGILPPGTQGRAGLPGERETGDGGSDAHHGVAPAEPATSEPALDAAPAGMAAAAQASPSGLDVVRPRRQVAGGDIASRAAASAGRHRTGLLSGVVLALAVLASLVAAGAFDAAHAAAEPAPALVGVGASGS